jgi:hypothetical protein
VWTARLFVFLLVHVFLDGVPVMRGPIPRRRRRFAQKYVAQLQYHIFVNGTRVSLPAYSQFS